MLNPPTKPNPLFTCSKPINAGPAHYALDAAVFWLNLWVTWGIAPPIAPRLQVASVNPVVFKTDANGNVLGGVRTPAVDAPVATLSGLPAPGGSLFCFLFGTTTPFSAAQLHALYPSHGQFAAKWVGATLSSWLHGYIVGADAWELAVAGIESSVGK
jgi:hypothetical protein